MSPPFNWRLSDVALLVGTDPLFNEVAEVIGVTLSLGE